MLWFLLPTDMQITVFERFTKNVQCAGVGIMKKKVWKVMIKVTVKRIITNSFFLLFFFNESKKTKYFYP